MYNIILVSEKAKNKWRIRVLKWYLEKGKKGGLSKW
jgi:hypothetical protein